jgi:hypothetical protein
MAVTHYVALPFFRTEDGTAPGEAQGSGRRNVTPANAGRSHSSVQAIRTLAGSDAVVLKKFGGVPNDLSEL